MRTARYHSQVGQDRLLDTVVFRGVEGGVFVDVGAHDGVTFSNSLAFERDRGWRCLCVEPNPAVFPELVRNRPDAACVNLALSDRAGTLPFHRVEGYGEMLSSLVEDTSQDHHRRVEREVALHGGTVHRLSVPVTTPAELFAAHGIEEVHVLSVDVEGTEARILAAIDQARTFVHLVDAECNAPADLRALSAALGPAFVLAGRHRHDAFFLNRKSPFLARLWPLRRAILAAAARRAVARLPGRLRVRPRRAAAPGGTAG